MLQAGAAVEARLAGAGVDRAAAGLVHEAGGAAAAEVTPDVGADALVLARVGAAAVSHDLAEVAREARGAQAGGVGGLALIVHAAASVLAGRAGGQQGAG